MFGFQSMDRGKLFSGSMLALISKFARMVMLMAIIEPAFGIPCCTILSPIQNAGTRCTCLMSCGKGGDRCCDCPYCEARHDIKECCVIRDCDSMRPFAQEPKFLGDAMNFFFGGPAGGANHFELILLMRVPGYFPSLSDGVKTRLIKPPQELLHLQTISL